MDFLTVLAMAIILGYILTAQLSARRIGKGVLYGSAALIVFFIFSMFGSASVQAEEPDLVEAHSTMALCAAASGLVSSKQEGYIAEVIGGVGTRYRSWLVLEIMATGDERADELADLLIQGMMRKIQAQYNSGAITWTELVDFSKGCALALEDAT